jgi:hypothetical protein
VESDRGGCYCRCLWRAGIRYVQRVMGSFISIDIKDGARTCLKGV